MNNYDHRNIAPQEFNEGLALLSQRRSVRGYLPEELPKATLERVFSVAQHAPSNCNTQPWQLAVVSGQRCRELAGKISAAMAVGEMSLDFPYDGVYQGVYRERQHRSAAALYSALGVTREDKAGRHEAFMRNFDFFGAPHVAFFFLPEPFGVREAADLGMYAQSVMLAMTALGIGCCPQTALSFHADMVRAELGLGDDLRLLFGLSFGYADPDHPSQLCHTERAALADTVQFFS
ncbi:nitroreductase [Spongiibacter sp.]|uniref:nitroreductase n=1 Tax=Spongiibacter sp. TaxID=2024860 RepID=UPI003562F895